MGVCEKINFIVLNSHFQTVPFFDISQFSPETIEQ